MNRSELVSAVAEKTEVSSKDVDSVLRTMQEVVVDAVKSGEKVTLQGFVAFERTERDARKGRNPATGESIDVPASKGVKVSAGSTFKKDVKDS